MYIALFIIGVGILGIFGELINRRIKTRDISRKFVHVGTGILYLIASYHMSVSDIILASIISALGLLVTRRLGFFPGVHIVKRISLGEIYYPLGISLAALISLPNHPEAFRFAVCILAFADASAALIGISFGKIKYLVFGGKKTIEGSLAFFVVGFAICLIFTGNFDIKTVYCLIALLMVEASLVFGLDNVALPPAAAYLYMTLLS